MINCPRCKTGELRSLGKDLDLTGYFQCGSCNAVLDDEDIFEYLRKATESESNA